MSEFDGHQTIFGLLGNEASYRFTQRFDELDVIADELLSKRLKLQFLEMYALDLYQHWNLDQADGMHNALRRTDEFVATLANACAAAGYTFLLLSDHGQEQVKNTIPLFQTLKQTKVSNTQYTYFCELACARFWFHSDQARETIIPSLHKLQNCKFLHYRDMHQFHVCFDDDLFGEYYLMAEPGAIFFPRDFYHGLANFYLGLFGHSQRNRLFNPVHRGNHGYLPQHPSEKGFLLLADDEIKLKQDYMELIDFAPSILTYLGVTPPERMAGKHLF